MKGMLGCCKWNDPKYRPNRKTYIHKYTDGIPKTRTHGEQRLESRELTNINQVNLIRGLVYRSILDSNCKYRYTEQVGSTAYTIEPDTSKTKRVEKR